MSISIKAAIFSAIIFPGAGYFVVKDKSRGFIAFLIAAICLGLIGYESFYKAQVIAQKIVSGTISYDVNVILEQIKTVPGILNPDVVTGLFYTIIFVWIFTIIDSYRLGKSLKSRI